MIFNYIYIYYIYIYIYITYIYTYVNKNNTKEALSMFNQITTENTDNSAI